MRTYQSSTKEKKANKKVVYGVLLTLSILALAAIITLSLIFGNGTPVDNTPQLDPPVDVPPVTGEDPTFVMPIENYTIGKEASLTKVVYSSSMNYWRTHNGIDLLADENTPVSAVSDGVVKSVQHTILEGSIVTIEHEGGLVSIYKGLSTDIVVAAGDTVKAGDVIGAVAAVMPLERDDGPHLHLEMKLNGKFVDPAGYLPELGNK